ncbi:MAG: hypothetical protein H0Z34_03315 [Brevibacillus sp.]|nr:hypothetical protein [Brevibacillus sp.]
MLTFLGEVSNCKEIVALNLLNHYGFGDMYQLLGRYLDFRYTRNDQPPYAFDVSFESGLYESIQQLYGINLVRLVNLKEVHAAIREEQYPVIRVDGYHMPYMSRYYRKYHVYHYIIAEAHDAERDQTKVFDDLLSFSGLIDRRVWEQAAVETELEAFRFDLREAGPPDENKRFQFLRQQAERLYRDYLVSSTACAGSLSLQRFRDDVAALACADPDERREVVEQMVIELVSIPHIRHGFARYAKTVGGDSQWARQADILANNWQTLFRTMLRQLYQDQSCIDEIVEKLDRIREQERLLVQANYDFFHSKREEAKGEWKHSPSG